MIKRELKVFLIVGSLTVGLDFVTYHSLIWMGVLGVDLAKAIGFLAGTLFAYFANRLWTFGHHAPAPGSPLRFALLYTTTLTANVLVNAGCLALFSTLSMRIQAAFLFATGFSAILNFLGMKLFVFKVCALSEKP
jgi:putative flippase GtrA